MPNATRTLGGLISLIVVGCAQDIPLPNAAAEEISVNEAKHLIATGDNLTAIPKSTWCQLVPADQYHILWEQDTERPFSGQYVKNNKDGIYVTSGCRIPVFRPQHQFDSGTGWPSFWEVFDAHLLS